MSKQSRERARELAKHLKDRQIERTTGACPWGCGRPVANGGGALLAHLTRCQGSPRARTGRAS